MKIGHCASCFQVTWLTRHHLKPRRAGGSDSSRNIVKICNPCHMKEERAIERGLGTHSAIWRKRQAQALELDAQSTLRTQICN